MSEPFLGCRAKLSRALAYLQLLDQQIGTFGTWFQQNHPYSLVPHTDTQTGKTVVRLGVPTPQPTSEVTREWGLIIGDLVHNTRSALDHAIEELTIRSIGTPLEKTEFPVFRKDEHFCQENVKALEFAPNSGMYRIRGVTYDAACLIETMQPYRRMPDTERHHLAALTGLWNQDKHRVIPLVAMASSVQSFALGGSSVHIEYFSTEMINFRVPFKDDEELFSIFLGPGTSPDAYSNIELAPQIVFPDGEPGLGEPVVPLLAECIIAVSWCISALEDS